jgi:hypothetical protein
MAKLLDTVERSEDDGGRGNYGDAAATAFGGRIWEGARRRSALGEGRSGRG